MGRLIDADELILHLNDYALQEATFMKVGYSGKYDAIQECMKAVEEQPTAYDVDKIVDQLESNIENSMNGANDAECAYWNKGIEKAIEIVKGGGVDE